MNKQTTAIFVFFLLLFIFFYYAAPREYPDAGYLKTAMRIFAPEAFRFPLLYYVSLPFYLLLGETMFLVLPLVFYFGGIAFLCKSFSAFKINLLWLFAFFMLVFFSVWFISSYTRDSLTWLLSCAFAYWFFLHWTEKQNHFGKLFALAMLGFFARPQAVLLILLFTLLVTKEVKNVFWDNRHGNSIIAWFAGY